MGTPTNTTAARSLQGMQGLANQLGQANTTVGSTLNQQLAQNQLTQSQLNQAYTQIQNHQQYAVNLGQGNYYTPNLQNVPSTLGIGTTTPYQSSASYAISLGSFPAYPAYAVGYAQTATGETILDEEAKKTRYISLTDYMKKKLLGR